MKKYWNIFESLDDVRKEFEPERIKTSRFNDEARAEGTTPYFPTDDEIIFAWYEYEDYSGSAMVLYEHDGKLYEVNGGHCSCYGLEGQWEPEETTWAALDMRQLDYTIDEPAARDELKAYIQSKVAATTV